MITVGTILIVDDSAMMRGVLKKSLGIAKFIPQTIHEASNGFEAIEVLKKHSIDLMFCDLNMPGLGGDALLSCVAEHAIGEPPPVVIVSSEATPERLKELKNDRIVGVLRKPFTPEQVAKVVLESQATHT